MPYIGSGPRALVDGFVEGIVDEASRMDERKVDGLVEYVLYQLLHRLYFNEGSKFFDMNRGVGILGTTRSALEDDWLKPYERRKLAARWSE